MADHEQANMAGTKTWNRRVRVAGITSIFGAVFMSAAFACGYENPSNVALGLLNWTYPKALWVRSAVWQAENAGILPAREAKPAKDIFGGAFRRAAASVSELGKRINAATPATEEAASFSVVLIPAAMWTRYAPTVNGYAVKVHADGPASGDVVIVTDEKVVQALVDGSLDAVAAESNGLLRFYGPDNRQRAVRRVLVAATSTTGRASETGTSLPPEVEPTSVPASCHPGHELGGSLPRWGWRAEETSQATSMNNLTHAASDLGNKALLSTGNE